jgi:hypothetical protein
MEHQSCLSIETFLAVAEMVASQLRIKEADRWSPQICQLKYVSFCSEFPEVSDAQFLWAAEQWLQTTGGREFLRYPTWRELMVPLYRAENGLANRSWGFRPDLPTLCHPTDEQLRLLPAAPRSIALPPDPTNGDAYVPFMTEELPCLPPAADEGPGLTPKKWADYLMFLAEIDPDGTPDQQGSAAVDSREGTSDRQVVGDAVQPQRQGASASEP